MYMKIFIAFLSSDVMVRLLTPTEIKGLQNYLRTKYDYPLEEWQKDNRQTIS